MSGCGYVCWSRSVTSFLQERFDGRLSGCDYLLIEAAAVVFLIPRGDEPLGTCRVGFFSNPRSQSDHSRSSRGTRGFSEELFRSRSDNPARLAGTGVSAKSYSAVK